MGSDLRKCGSEPVLIWCEAHRLVQAVAPASQPDGAPSVARRERTVTCRNAGSCRATRLDESSASMGAGHPEFGDCALCVPKFCSAALAHGS